METHQTQEGIFFCQRKYAIKILKKFKMQNYKLVSTPLDQKEKLCKEDGANKVDGGVYRSLISCLLYLIGTILDIMFAASLLSRFMQDPSELHFNTAKTVHRYINGTEEFGIWLKKLANSKLTGYIDREWLVPLRI